MTTATLQGKARKRRRANPFRNGPAMLRSARADGWFPKLRDLITRLLNKQVRQSAALSRTLEPNITPKFLTDAWEEEMFIEQRRLAVQMANEGFKDAGQEFFGGKSFADPPSLKAPSAALSRIPAFRGKTLESDLQKFVTGEEADLPILVSESVGADVNASFLTEAKFDRINDHLRQVARLQTRRSADLIQRVFDRAKSEGLLPRETAKLIEVQGAGFTKARANMIARTETIWAYNEGAEQRYESLGVAVKEWVVTKDSLLCPWCKTMDGVRVSTGSPFWKEGQSLIVAEGGKNRKLNFKMDVSHPPLHPHCVVPGTKVRFGELYGASRAWYEGSVIEVGLSDGRRLTVTPNHMLLTPDGFASAKLLCKGDQVIDCSALERIVFGDPNDGDGPPLVEDVFRSLRESSGMTTMRVPVSPEHFHGEGDFVKGKVEVVASNGFLLGDLPSSPAEFVRKRGLRRTDMQELLLAGACSFSNTLLALGLTSDGGMGSRGIAPVFSRRALRHHQAVGFQVGSDGNTSFSESPFNDDALHTETFGESKKRHSGAIRAYDPLDRKGMPSLRWFDAIPLQDAEDGRFTNPELLREACRRGSGLIQTADVLFCLRREFRGHVYDLHALESLYTISGLVSSNCRCVLVPVLEDPPIAVMPI